ncbi:MAG: DegT/DnrJ/EryC1/StrS family aminotransferase [Candidatus Margulisbacteria bacterium]|nr:DegT/DnrJ/EryC1/StrS family aminotransferase [Candidatus Margulisiibacteriota bacterium]
MTVPFFDITRQNDSLRKEIDAAVSRVIDKGRFILGENVTLLEKEFAAYCGTKFAVGVASGTDALHLALRACGVKEGDEVLTTPFTFVATAEAIAYCGATPVFIDIEPKTFNIDPARIKEKITKKTRAILPVHLYGLASDLGAIGDIAREHGLKLIEDCAQAAGAEADGRKVGGFGEAGCFSFFPTKNLGCFGDGGLVTTNDEKIADEIRILRGHGSRKTYHYDLIGYNSRLDELQAAVLRVKLPHLDGLITSRQKKASIYYKHLKNLSDIVLPHEPAGHKHTYNQYTIRTERRDDLFEFLKMKSIGSMVYYPLSLHLQKAFAGLKHSAGAFPQSEKAQAEVISLPIFPELTDQEAEDACHAIASYFER